ncbi:succinylglutamate desuccinylase/aspartoacylase family protein [Corallincola platygyrae]|uniref:Succinylglutamate desuccinylase/aspartoacylase family protein n=1 Tax=Corallincola platygyrae TaxID=1193278 RepID=A0ABW4XT02_9GAMM
MTAPRLNKVTIARGERLDKALLGPDVISWLKNLSGPTWIEWQGESSVRQRVIVTLLHGNEPSGIEALHAWLSSGLTPAMTCHLIIGVIGTALTKPYFSHRHLPELRDLNRCFDGPTDDLPGQLAQQIWQTIEQLQPEAVLDLHNTSGSGPAFAVSVSDSSEHQALASLFCQRMIVTDVFLGALMEKTRPSQPIVTIECGGAIDPESKEVAKEGLYQFLTAPKVTTYQHYDWDIELLSHPKRVVLSADMSIAMAERAVKGADLTLVMGIEHFNFGEVTPDNRLAWIGPSGIDTIQVVNGQGDNLCRHYFQVIDGALYPKRPLKLFMITPNLTIAQEDCLFYLVDASID